MGFRRNLETIRIPVRARAREINKREDPIYPISIEDSHVSHISPEISPETTSLHFIQQGQAERTAVSEKKSPVPGRLLSQKNSISRGGKV